MSFLTRLFHFFGCSALWSELETTAAKSLIWESVSFRQAATGRKFWPRASRWPPWHRRMVAAVCDAATPTRRRSWRSSTGCSAIGTTGTVLHVAARTAMGRAAGQASVVLGGIARAWPAIGAVRRRDTQGGVRWATPRTRTTARRQVSLAERAMPPRGSSTASTPRGWQRPDPRGGATRLDSRTGPRR